MTDEPDARTAKNCPGGGAPGHDWAISHASVAGRGALTTSVVEVCERCHAIRLDEDAEVVGDDD